MKTFISCNGMIVMADFLDSDNLYLRGQALEVILSGTDCDVFDWFKPPSSYGDKVLHQNLLAFGRSPLIMTKLFANRIGSYPGGSFRALQVIAFVLSWIRALYTADQKLQLSKVAVQNLKDWAKYEGPLPILNPETSYLRSEDPELQLAYTLLDDFTGSKNAPTDTATVTQELNVPVVETTEKLTSSGDFIVSNLDTTSLANTELPTSSIPTHDQLSVGQTTSESMIEKELTVLDMKERGNSEFKAGQYTTAIEWYHKGITALKLTNNTSEQTQTEEYTDTELAASLYTNAATAAWKIVQDALIQLPELELQAIDLSSSKEDQASKNDANTEDVDNCGSGEKNTKLVMEFHSALHQCCSDCTLALQLLPHHTKAAYRLASLYLLQQNSQQALNVVNTCITANTVRKEGNSMRKVATEEDGVVEASVGSADLDMLQQIKRRCLASVLLSTTDEYIKQDRDLGNLGMNNKTNEVLSNLLVQYQIELDLPVLSASSVTSTSKTTEKVHNNMENIMKSAATSGTKKSLSSTVTGIVGETKTTEKGNGGGNSSSTGSKVSAEKNTTEKVKTKKKKATSSASGTSSIAQRLQQIDDDLLDALMKKGSIKA